MQLFTCEKKKPREISASIKTKLFGKIPVFRQDIDEEYIKSYFLGILVGKASRQKHTTFQDGSWHTVLTSKGPVGPAPSVSRNAITSLPEDGDIRLDIDRALTILPNINRIALVFFMGIGDYYYATPFIEKLKKKYPDIPLVAYVSNQVDNFNSPLVADCLRFDPNIAEVRTYVSQPTEFWRDYDYSDAVRQEPETTLVLPMVYDHSSETLSRDDALCDTFSLPRSVLVPRPIVHDIPTSPHVAETLEQILDIVKKRSLRGVVWFQMRSRSTKFVFNHSEDLAKKLVDAGYFVVSVDPLEMKDERCLSLDLNRFRITDSIRLLQLLNERTKTYCLIMTSCFWAVSSALDIPNLGVSFLYDHCQKTVYYPNIYMVTYKPYYCVPRMKQFLARPEEYENDHGIHYKTDYLFDCFQKMVEDCKEK